MYGKWSRVCKSTDVIDKLLVLLPLWVGNQEFQRCYAIYACNPTADALPQMPLLPQLQSQLRLLQLAMSVHFCLFSFSCSCGLYSYVARCRHLNSLLFVESIYAACLCCYVARRSDPGLLLFLVFLQLVFAVVSPGAVIPNLVAGAIAEAGAQQAGDLMQVRVHFSSCSYSI